MRFSRVLARVTIPAAIIVSFLVCNSAIAEDWVQWDETKNGNGHWYRVLRAPDPGIAWEDAKRQAEQMGGYLATITSANENAFVFSLVDDSKYWRSTKHLGPRVRPCNMGPWLGGYRGDNGRGVGWRWITDEPFDFKAWANRQPDNNPTYGQQDKITFFAWGYTSREPKWDDNGGNDPETYPVAFVVEADTLGSDSFPWIWIILGASVLVILVIVLVLLLRNRDEQ
ncbi:MAG: hypothetical protein QGG42_16405 [Phycisphaerae bacterium]|jgi:hypothetical protein|nr:hypothetical protein [Phycisphaerae bacterium]